MIGLDDARWSKMTGGYRTAFDPRPLLLKLETDLDTPAVWRSVWEELHHQGDVGESSFAAVPFLVENYQKGRVLDWNIYAFVAVIELARNEGENPDVPESVAEDYFRAIRNLAAIGATQLTQAKTTEQTRAMLAVLAIERGLRLHGKFLVNYTEDELMDIYSRA